MLYTLTSAATIRDMARATLAAEIRNGVKANETGTQVEGLSLDEAQLLRVALASQGFVSYIWQELGL